MQNSTTFGQIFISYFAKLQNFRQNFNFMSCKILWNSRKSLRNSRKILRNYENEGKIVYSYLTYFHAQTTRQNGPQKRNTTYELLFKLLKISHNTPTKHSHPTLSNNTLKQHSHTTLTHSVVEPAGAGLFCRSRSWWKSFGSWLLLCGLGVLWWQSSANSYKI